LERGTAREGKDEADGSGRGSGDTHVSSLSDVPRRVGSGRRPQRVLVATNVLVVSVAPLRYRPAPRRGTLASVRRAMTLRAQLLVLQVVIVLVLVCTTGVVASALQERQLREAYVDRMTGVAQSVARLPVILDAFDDADPSATIQPVAEVIREASGVTYVVVTDDRGIRY